MTKKQTDHSWGSGIMAIAWGYVINARPGPEKESVDLTHKAVILFWTQNICMNIFLKACLLHATTPECCCTPSWYDHLPDSATCEIGTPCSWAMNPNTEKTANPATILVQLFNKHRYRLFLKNTTTELCSTSAEKCMELFHYNWIPPYSGATLLTWVFS